MDDDARKLESVKFAQESAKQILTLATALVTLLSGAISTGIVDARGPIYALMFATFFCLVLSVAAGILTLFALSGILSDESVFITARPLDSRHYALFGRTQFFSFCGAVIFIAVIGIVAPWRPDLSRFIPI